MGKELTNPMTRSAVEIDRQSSTGNLAEAVRAKADDLQRGKGTAEEAVIHMNEAPQVGPPLTGDAEVAAKQAWTYYFNIAVRRLLDGARHEKAAERGAAKIVAATAPSQPKTDPQTERRAPTIARNTVDSIQRILPRLERRAEARGADELALAQRRNDLFFKRFFEDYSPAALEAFAKTFYGIARAQVYADVAVVRAEVHGILLRRAETDPDVRRAFEHLLPDFARKHLKERP